MNFQQMTAEFASSLEFSEVCDVFVLISLKLVFSEMSCQHKVFKGW